MSRLVRDIVVIDEEKCDGCGVCVPACAEGALQIIDGKARLVSEVYCDGLGSCLGECPQGAISVERREADDFDEEAARRHVESHGGHQAESPVAELRGPAFAVETNSRASRTMERHKTGLPNWPIQLGLVAPAAGFLKGADVVLAADCTGYSYAGFRDFVADRPVLIACPKLDDSASHLSKLTAILSQASVRSITVLRMEVPCCSGLLRLVMQAAHESDTDMPVHVLVVGMDGYVAPQ